MTDNQATDKGPAPEQWKPILRYSLQQILTEHPQGLSEYELIKLLQQAPYCLLDGGALTEPLALFQTHFVLFNALYQLRAEWRQAKTADLEIHTTCIRQLDYQKQPTELSLPDPLQHYYLDWRHFSQTSAADVEQLLTQFWLKMAGPGAGHPQPEDQMALTEALAFFDLPADATFEQIRRRYLRLQHQMHPDKGGEKSQSQTLEQHYQCLKQHVKFR